MIIPCPWLLFPGFSSSCRKWIGVRKPRPAWIRAPDRECSERGGVANVSYGSALNDIFYHNPGTLRMCCDVKMAERRTFCLASVELDGLSLGNSRSLCIPITSFYPRSFDNQHFPSKMLHCSLVCCGVTPWVNIKSLCPKTSEEQILFLDKLMCCAVILP